MHLSGSSHVAVVLVIERNSILNRKMAKILVLCLATFACHQGSVLAADEDKKADLRTFLHLSDIHLDFDYVENGIATKKQMCHASANQGQIGNASKYGDYNCDSPRLLVESAFEAMKKFVPDPDFILWTGDNSPHVDYMNKSNIMNHLRFVTKKLNKKYPGVPVIPVLG